MGKRKTATFYLAIIIVLVFVVNVAVGGGFLGIGTIVVHLIGFVIGILVGLILGRQLQTK